MENLELVESHRKRIGLLLALFLFLSIYAIIFVFKVTSLYYQNIQENKNLLSRVERVSSIALTYDSLRAANDPELNIIIDTVLAHSYVYSDSRVLIDDIWVENLSQIDLDYDTVNVFWDWKLYKTQVIRDEVRYDIIVWMPHKNFLSKLTPALLFFLILSPFAYTFLAILMCRFMTQMYKPLKEIIENLESFASNINHEFKTSLTEIISSLELAKLTKEYEEANSYSVQSARRLDSMLDTLWMLIHFVNSDYRKERINLYKTLDESIDDLETLIKDKHIKLDKKYDPQKYLYKYIDKSPLILSFQNLLKNAIKYSEVGWKVEIWIYKNYFSIKDYGIWIEEENLDKIFDRYFRESYAKSWNGIGLSIIKRITEIYNWEIKISSKKWKYTHVKIYY